MQSPSPAHVIRLRGPWEIRPLARTILLDDGSTEPESGSLPTATRVDIPADWGAALGDDFRGRVRYTRRFGRPSNLSAGETVSLVIEQIDWIGDVTLNGKQLGRLRFGHPPAVFEVTPLLKFRNELVIDVELPRTTPETDSLLKRADRAGRPGGVIGEVRLEIGEAAAAN